MEKRNFIKNYAKALNEGTAAVFGGAGLSAESGFVNWKELLREFAMDIRLDIEKEDDLIAVAQYYLNVNMGNKHTITQEILKKFTKKAKINKTMNALVELPIKSYWTTNYDTVIEDTLTNADIPKVVNKRDADFNNDIGKYQVVVNKIHGDVSEPNNIILTKDDYANFSKSRAVFINHLQAELTTKTFLFIGYSFNDPNLIQIIENLRIQQSKNGRQHFWIKKGIIRKDYINEHQTNEENEEAQKLFEYDLIKNELIKQDFQRLNISVIELANYDEIPALLNEVQKHYLTQNVFVAGSARDYGEWSKKDSLSFLFSLGYKLIENDYNVATGFSEGVGPQIVNGVLTKLTQDGLKIQDRLKIKPLPLDKGSDKNIDPDAKKMFQKDMITSAGVVVIVFGNNFYENEEKARASNGVLHDFERAIKYNKYIIPVGSTGYAALEIHNHINQNMDDFPYLQKYMESLMSEKKPEELADLVIKILDDIKTLSIQ